MNKWDAKFGFFWYNDDELFRFKQDDFDEKAKKIADSGINIVMTFSCTHFRWSFHRYWDRILNCIEMTVKACHKYGIKVVEHHSSHLTFNPLNKDQWDYVERVMRVRGSSISSWEGLAENINDEIYENGVQVSSFRQIDGRTGEHARSNYNGYCMCFNNPDYKKAYFGYLDRVYKTGVDGIMTDDVQFFAMGNACACNHCKSLFKEETGYDLPKPGTEWEKFWGDYDNPVYIAWERFRRKSTERFQRSVNAHFKSLGLNLLRPNYVSSAINNNPTGYCFDMGADLWDWIFQENCFSTIIRVSWPTWYVESLHRYALAQRNNVPSMSLFYPDREDTYYFVWALAASWGQMLTVTPEGHDLSSIEKKYRSFEKKYNNIYTDPQKIASVAILFSLDTAYYVKSHRHTHDVFCWGQGLYFSNIPVDMVFADDTYEKLYQYDYIILPNVNMLKDEHIEKFLKYVKAGGKLIITGIPGAKNFEGVDRSIEKIVRSFGLPEFTQLTEINCKCKNNNSDRIQYMLSILCNNNNVFTYGKNKDTGIKQNVGNGFIYWIPNGPDLKLQNSLNSDRFQQKEIRPKSPEYVVNQIKDTMGDLLKYIFKDIPIDSENFPADWLLTSYKSSTGEKLTFHIVNTYGAIPKVSTDIGHSDPVPSFVKEYRSDYEGNAKIKLRNNFKLKSAILITPEQDIEINIAISESNGWYEITIPKGLFNSYAAIVCDIK